MIKNILNLGDAALYCDFGSEVNKEINSKVIRYFRSIQKENIDGVNNLTPSYNKLIISFDLRKKNFQTIKKLIENLNVTNDDKLETNRIAEPALFTKSKSKSGTKKMWANIILVNIVNSNIGTILLILRK